MDQLLSKLEKAADVVIIDGPPFVVADAMVMASKVDGVLLVVRPGHTRRSLAVGASEQIKRTGARVIGVVLNRIPLRGADYYTGKSYFYSYYHSNYGDEGAGKEKKTNLGKWRKTLSPRANKAIDFIIHLFEAVSKASPK
jgi:Mrp family chromosome partitioning ATPase